jgi:hypothetical protein
MVEAHIKRALHNTRFPRHRRSCTQLPLYCSVDGSECADVHFFVLVKQVVQEMIKLVIIAERGKGRLGAHTAHVVCVEATQRGT